LGSIILVVGYLKLTKCICFNTETTVGHLKKIIEKKFVFTTLFGHAPEGKINKKEKCCMYHPPSWQSKD